MLTTSMTKGIEISLHLLRAKREERENCVSFKYSGGERHVGTEQCIADLEGQGDKSGCGDG